MPAPEQGSSLPRDSYSQSEMGSPQGPEIWSPSCSAGSARATGLAQTMWSVSICHQPPLIMESLDVSTPSPRVPVKKYTTYLLCPECQPSAPYAIPLPCPMPHAFSSPRLLYFQSRQEWERRMNPAGAIYTSLP
ncbi:hypothetical protein KIL84_003446 [Mauremys mutica]|uniref:Uncharacterized protein n=1 Tax=Mauremys mutica TaxID=74926 RepID=A0A9D3WV79_9SAUR|nr:hypothetical protein KIL84_003446 [Mauremys mutica]